MSGHSHWATIRRKKEAVDSKRGRAFSKIARRITLCAREGGGKPEANLSLQYAIDDARSVSMPKDTIERAIKKGTGELGGEELHELSYEGYAPGGVAVLIEAVTDNKNRTASEVRHIMERHGANLAGAGSTAWLFEKKGLIQAPAKDVDEDDLLGVVLEAGAEDMQRVGDSFQVTCATADFAAVRAALKEKKIAVDSAELTFVPQNTVDVNESIGRRILNLMEALEENDDVQNVYANFELPEALLAELA